MNRQHDLPELDYDDPPDTNLRGRRRREEIVRDDDEGEQAMPSWSWTGLAFLCLIGIAGYYLIYEGAVAAWVILTK